MSRSHSITQIDLTDELTVHAACRELGWSAHNGSHVSPSGDIKSGVVITVPGVGHLVVNTLTGDVYDTYSGFSMPTGLVTRLRNIYARLRLVDSAIRLGLRYDIAEHGSIHESAFTVRFDPFPSAKDLPDDLTFNPAV